MRYSVIRMRGTDCCTTLRQHAKRRYGLTTYWCYQGQNCCGSRVQSASVRNVQLTMTRSGVCVCVGWPTGSAVTHTRDTHTYPAAQDRYPDPQLPSVVPLCCLQLHVRALPVPACLLLPVCGHTCRTALAACCTRHADAYLHGCGAVC